MVYNLFLYNIIVMVILKTNNFIESILLVEVISNKLIVVYIATKLI